MVSAPQSQSEPGALEGFCGAGHEAGWLVLKLIADSGMGQSSPDGFMGVEKRGLCQRVTPRKWGLIAEQEGYL